MIEPRTPGGYSGVNAQGRLLGRAFPGGVAREDWLQAPRSARPLLSEEQSARVLILLTNDDGIYAPGLGAIQRELSRLGEVFVVAPATEQSGVGHSITYLKPLVVKEVFDGERHWGWMVEGSPADCVRIAIAQLCPGRPDLVVSGINGGLNAGINVLYSGTVAAAIEGAFFGITSVAVSLQFDEHPGYGRAAQLARQIIQQILEQKRPEPQLYNVNIPTAALTGTPRVKTVPMDVVHYGERFERRIDPWGRAYYWATGEPAPPRSQQETDLTALAEGCVTVTPLDYNMTRRAALAEMQQWQFRFDGADRGAQEPAQHGAARPVVRSGAKTPKIVGD